MKDQNLASRIKERDDQSKKGLNSAVWLSI